MRKLLFIFVLFIAVVANAQELDYSEYGAPKIEITPYSSNINLGDNYYMVIPKINLKGASTTPPELLIYQIQNNGSLDLKYVKSYPVNGNSQFARFNFTVADDGRATEYVWQGHSGYVIIKDGLCGTSDTVTAGDLGYDQIRPHLQYLVADDNILITLTQNLGSPDTTIVFTGQNALPYVIGSDTITDQTTMRYEYIVVHDLNSGQNLLEIPLWNFLRPSDLDPTHFTSGGVVSTLPGAHANSIGFFDDSLGYVFGYPHWVFAVSAKELHQIWFVSEDGSEILRAENNNQGDFIFKSDMYSPAKFQSLQLSDQHGLVIEPDGYDLNSGVLDMLLYNNGKSQGFAEGLVLQFDFKQNPTRSYSKAWVGLHPDTLASNRLGNIQYMPIANQSFFLVNWGGQSKNSQNFSIMDPAGNPVVDYDFADQYDEAFKITVLEESHPFIQQLLSQLPTVTHDNNVLEVDEVATEYFWGNGDTTISSSISAPTDTSMWTAGTRNSCGGLFINSYTETVGVETSTNNDIAVFYPNPSQQGQDIYLSESVNGGVVEITDIAGKLLVQKPVTSQTISMDHLTPGMYIISVISNGGIVALKQRQVIY
ncbi:MAG: T9SS type A sorting domain-containing protein [Candidatus Nomurabacteria bacterium]|nr:T9SS type A sorting domain-containing protein [Candidatus Nomurabacteria bacterium]